ncbi:prolyl hydroxylase family protein [Parvularcula marina]|uniref:Fe2OG dioxygenase domain-containing protein n=1 Tax=Parvularcula marina TaxID=2292771 RepID=A0A371RIQ2_9PROT|nr:2OG-Fe(II) oxygenase [Parvularcula marina]RFB05335.1 hypothetical protein DX908_08745 [Parvularcula marina]
MSDNRPGQPGVAPGWQDRLSFSETGYLTQKPALQTAWAEVAGEQPEGIAYQRGAVPPGFVIIQNFLPAGLCDQIVAECAQKEGTSSTVGEGAGHKDYRDDVRRSDYIDPADISLDITGIVGQSVMETVAPLMAVMPEWFEKPEILRYPVGGEFLPHADADVFDAEARRWNRVENRDVSLLIYLNEGYQGGEIQFPNFGLSLPPRRGMLIAFPSDGRYAHAARPVTMGTKYALVSWIAGQGSPRVGPPRPGVVKLA